MVIHINKLYIHTAVVTHVCTYAPKKIYILVPGIQTNTNSSTTVPVHIYVLTTDTGVDHERVWQPYAVDPSYSAISKWWPYLLALYINTDQ